MPNKNPFPDLPLPAGARCDGWGVDPDRTQWRAIRSTVRRVQDCDASVCASAVQYADGRIDRAGICVDIPGASLTAEQARELGALLIGAAYELREWR